MMSRAEYLDAEIRAAEYRLASLVLSDADRANLAGWVREMKEERAELACDMLEAAELAFDAKQERDRARRLKAPFADV